jgi:ketosteroid isomerase-like protein
MISNKSHDVNNEAQIRALIERWAQAVREENRAAIRMDHDSDILMFDLPPPFLSRGVDAYMATYVTWQFGTTRTNTDHIYTRPNTSGGDLDITMSVHDGGTESLWINGERVQQLTGNLPALGGTTGAAVFGEGLNGTPFNGRMAEVMVWNRTLTDSERVAADEYLKAKYGIR